MNTLSAPLDGRRDLEVISLIGLVHGVSHFSFAVAAAVSLADGRVWFKLCRHRRDHDGVFVVSGVGQAMAGFCGSLWRSAVLAGGISCFVLAGLTLHFATGLPDAGGRGGAGRLGNSVFHPADFTVLNRHVSPARLGMRFLRMVSANLGWACAPLLLTTLWPAPMAGDGGFGAVLVALPGFAGAGLAARGDCRAMAPAAPRRRGRPRWILRSRPVCCAFVFLFYRRRLWRHPELCQPDSARRVWPGAAHRGAGLVGVYMLARLPG